MESMSAKRLIWRLAPALLACCLVGSAWARLPAPSEEAKAKAAEAREKSAASDKAAADALATYQDRIAEYYRKDKARVVKTSAAPATRK
jgi:hypothetical protein